MSNIGPKSNAPAHLFVRRTKELAIEHLDPLLGPLTEGMARGMFETGRFGWMRRIPAKPRMLDRWATPPIWPAEPPPDAPEELRSAPGIARDRLAEQRAFEERPLHDFTKTHREAVTYIVRHSWTWLIAPYPALRRALTAIDHARAQAPAPGPAVSDEHELARMISAQAARLGISAVGFTAADSKYTYAEYQDPGQANIIVCVLEQDRDATATAPSSRAERAAFRAYGQLAARVARLSEYVQSLGYDARPNDFLSSEAVAIKYAVDAGLGQLGLNGQLLTPMAGSRCRLALITTEAPVAHDQPRDLGIPRICDECQICVRRCPPGAIPKARREKRGVVKAAIKPERCFPIVAQAHGCAVCMKVCPVQHYGLAAVTEHFVKTGRILGKGSDELEGYTWPLDARYYGPGETPRISSELLNPPGWYFDPTRTEPPAPDDRVGPRHATAGAGS
jgi:ferredoxin